MNSQKVSLCLLVLAFLAAAVLADVYMHNPRGSNDRNCEKNENRNTGNRLFDSQNNAKGGYACPRGLKTDTPTMYYYQGSILPVQWTSQHSCGIDNNYCHIILQYMCSSENPTLRDGTPTEADPTATNRPDENTKDDANVGQHETFEYYKKCATRTRQNGLYIADQNIGTTSSATRTRQNPNGGRNGWECAEERDYYPYWHPTPWRDIAIFTNDMTQCEMYRSESQNVKDKGECWSIPADSTSASVYLSYNNYFDCVNSGKGEWKESGKFDIPAPQCLSTDLIAARDNHLGTTLSGKPAQYNWVLPFNIVSDACVLRIRYNISTDDVKFDLDYKSNAEESAIKQDPLGSYGMASTLSMAVNTNQFGRTFQDRSYVFAIKKREGISSSAKIYNVNVIGKRGNIVQTYPALEYRFVPEHLSISADDYVHFQWTGSDYNPNRNPNDGEGGPRDPDGGLRADRSNVVQMDYPGLSIPRPAQYNTMFVKSNGKPDMDLINKLAFIDQDITNATACYSQAQIEAELEKDKNFEFDIRNCAKLNGAKTPYFDAKPIKLRSTGTFWYFSTRNNNFSNRGQKASITVSGGQFSSANRMDSSIVVALVTLVLSVFFML